MKKSEIAQKYPHTWVVYKNYRPYCTQSFYNKCINLFKYPNLPFEDIQEPTWIICEKYLTSPERFKESVSRLYKEIVDLDTNIMVAKTYMSRKVRLTYTYGANKDSEDRLFIACYKEIQRLKDLEHKEIVKREQDNIRQEIINSYTK